MVNIINYIGGVGFGKSSAKIIKHLVEKMPLNFMSRDQANEEGAGQSMKFYNCEPQPHVQEASQHYALDTKAFSIEADPVDRNCYRASAETATLGALELACIHTTNVAVSRKHEEFMAAAFKSFSLVHVIEGELVISHHSGTSAMQAGEFTLMDNSHTRKMVVNNRVSLLLVKIPSQVLKRYLTTPEVFAGLTMGAAIDSGRQEESVFAPLLAVWEKMKSGSLRESAPYLSEEFLKRVSKIYTSRFPGQSNTALRRIAEVKQAIEEQLCNPELSVEAIADRMGVTSRRLRGLFRDSERISRLILRRRLEECARQLHSPICKHFSIAAIARQCGFISPAHFSRAFRKHFGYTAREFRKRCEQ